MFNCWWRRGSLSNSNPDIVDYFWGVVNILAYKIQCKLKLKSFQFAVWCYAGVLAIICSGNTNEHYFVQDKPCCMKNEQ